MLREFIEQQQTSPQRPEVSFDGQVREMVASFDRSVDFLRDETRFPSGDINKLVTLLWRLVGNKETPTILDQWGVPSLSFIILGDELQRSGLVIIPQNYLNLVKTDPVMQLGAITFVGSQARDYYTGSFDSQGGGKTTLRASVYEAETLGTIKKMAANEGVNWSPNSYQSRLMAEYPDGLKSAPSGLIYPSPIYRIQRTERN